MWLNDLFDSEMGADLCREISTSLSLVRTVSMSDGSRCAEGCVIDFGLQTMTGFRER